MTVEQLHNHIEMLNQHMLQQQADAQDALNELHQQYQDSIMQLQMQQQNQEPQVITVPQMESHPASQSRPLPHASTGAVDYYGTPMQPLPPSSKGESVDYHGSQTQWGPSY